MRGKRTTSEMPKQTTRVSVRERERRADLWVHTHQDDKFISNQVLVYVSMWVRVR